MKKILGAIALLAAAQSPLYAQSSQDLARDGRGGNTDNVLTYGMGYHQHRYSTLKQISKQQCEAAGSGVEHSLASNYGEQAQPLVYDGVMFVTNAEHTIAIDVATGKQLWRTPVEFDPATPRVVCCGDFQQGTGDLLTARCSAARSTRTSSRSIRRPASRSGKQKIAEWKEGFSITVAPLVANGVLITGISGAEFGMRGFLDGLDPETGKQLWRRYTIPGARREGARNVARRGMRICVAAARPGSPARTIRSSTSSIGAPATRGRGIRRGRPGDNLYTASVLAIRPKTGEIVWHYQLVPNEMFDLDANWEWILADIDVERHEAQGHDAFVARRLSLRARPHQRQAARRPSRSRKSTGPRTSTWRPAGRSSPKYRKKVRAGEQIELWPSQWGAQELGARGVQSGNRLALRQHHAQLALMHSSCPSSTRSASATRA